MVPGICEQYVLWYIMILFKCQCNKQLGWLRGMASGMQKSPASVKISILETFCRMKCLSETELRIMLVCLFVGFSRLCVVLHLGASCGPREDGNISADFWHQSGAGKALPRESQRRPITK